MVAKPVLDTSPNQMNKLMTRVSNLRNKLKIVASLSSPESQPVERINSSGKELSELPLSKPNRRLSRLLPTPSVASDDIKQPSPDNLLMIPSSIPAKLPPITSSPSPPLLRTVSAVAQAETTAKAASLQAENARLRNQLHANLKEQARIQAALNLVSTRTDKVAKLQEELEAAKTTIALLSSTRERLSLLESKLAEQTALVTELEDRKSGVFALAADGITFPHLEIPLRQVIQQTKGMNTEIAVYHKSVQIDGIKDTAKENERLTREIESLRSEISEQLSRHEKPPTRDASVSTLKDTASLEKPSQQVLPAWAVDELTYAQEIKERLEHSVGVIITKSGRAVSAGIVTAACRSAGNFYSPSIRNAGVSDYRHYFLVVYVKTVELFTEPDDEEPVARLLVSEISVRLKREGFTVSDPRTAITVLCDGDKSIKWIAAFRGLGVGMKAE